jgi:hypothetical protein
MGAAADSHEEASPLLPPPAADEKQLPPPQDPVKGCADGVPVVMGEPVAAPPREAWDTGLLSCLGRNDDFCSSDVEVCKFPPPDLTVLGQGRDREELALALRCFPLELDWLIVLRISVNPAVQFLGTGTWWAIVI